MTKVRKFATLSQGQKIGYWTIVSQPYRIPKKYKNWTYNIEMVVVKCECGLKKEITTNSLYGGKTKSCGCKFALTVTKHGQSKTRIGNIYRKIKQRCHSENSYSYKNYGARGIRMCKEWLDDANNFYDWARKNGYQDSLTIERIDVNRGYSPDNCTWITMSKQGENKRNSLVVFFNGEKRALRAVCREINISYDTARKEYKNGTLKI